MIDLMERLRRCEEFHIGRQVEGARRLMCAACVDAAVAEALKEQDEEVARLRAAQFLPMGDNHHNALLCPYCDGAKAVATAVKSRDEEIEALTALLIAQETHSTEGARREERASIADWFQETFCPRAGVKGDEQHARGDCDYCNMAAAIRRPPTSAPEGTTCSAHSPVGEACELPVRHEGRHAGGGATWISR